MFTNDQLLHIAYAITLSMPEGEKKEAILEKIEHTIITSGTTEHNQELSYILGLPGREIGEDWFDDLEKHRQFYWKDAPQ